PADGEAELEDGVLPGARTERVPVARERAHVVAGQDHDGEGESRLRLELLDERAALRRLLVEQDRLELELHQEARDLLAHLVVAAVDDEHLAVGLDLADTFGVRPRAFEPLHHRLEVAKVELELSPRLARNGQVAETHSPVEAAR